MPTSSYRSSARNLWCVLIPGDNIFLAVLPFCLANCALLYFVEYLGKGDNFGFSPTGHGLLTMLVSFLVISKVNLAYDRYKSARHYIGTAFLQLRELNQVAIMLTVALDGDKSEIGRWRAECFNKIVDILDATKRVVQDATLAANLARSDEKSRAQLVKDSQISAVDPMVLAQALRLHLFNSPLDLQLLERVQLTSKLNEYISSYRILLDLSSTPLPRPLVAMGRTFLFLWTFTMPLVLRQGPFTDLWTAMAFLFFLTYGFVGLELVSIKLVDPFGDGAHDIRVTAMRDAVIVGMEQDFEGLNMQSVSQRRLNFRRQKPNKYRAPVDPNSSSAQYHSMGSQDSPVYGGEDA